MAVKFTKVCGSNRPRTKLDFGRVTKKVTKISDPGCCDEAGDALFEVTKGGPYFALRGLLSTPKSRARAQKKI